MQDLLIVTYQGVQLPDKNGEFVILDTSFDRPGGPCICLEMAYMALAKRNRIHLELIEMKWI